MKTLLKLLLFFICILFMLFQISCKDTSEPDPDDVGGANGYARQGFERLNDEAERLSNLENIEDANDIMFQNTFNQIEGLFDQALALDVDNPMANLGMAILEIMRMNYDPEFWALYNDMEDLGGGRPQSLLKNQLSFLSRVPILLAKEYSMDAKGIISIKRFEDYIVSSVNPRIENALGYLNLAINMASNTKVYVDTGEELIEFDGGEIYAFRASLHILNAAFYMLTSYEKDMVGTDGTYGWIEESMQNYAPAGFDDLHGEAYHYEVVNNVLKIDRWDYWDSDHYSKVFQEEVMAKTFKHNLFNNATFGTLNSVRLNNARTNILAAVSDINDGIDYIEAENDVQNNDVIKLEYITDLNDEISNHDPDNPPFMQNWYHVSDATEWLQNLISGGNYTTTNNQGVEITVNVSAFFNGAVSDIKAVIPYYHWNPSTDSWVEPEVETYGWDTSSFTFWYNGTYITIYDIYRVEFNQHKFHLNSGYFTDASGTEIADNELPYFPDYTFNGIYPGMTRAKFIQLFGD